MSETKQMRIALYQPDIAGNTGTLLRLCRCLNLTLDLIKPLGFSMSTRALNRAGLDYIDERHFHLHESFDTFFDFCQKDERRLLLLTTKADQPYCDFSYSNKDILLFGRETSGVPDDVREKIPHHLNIPMAENARSINLALSAAMVTGEALRQTGGFC